MKKLLFIDDTLANKISYYHIILFLVFLPFDRFYSEVILISFALHTLIHFKKMDWAQVFNLELLVLLAIFLLGAVSTTYSSNKGQGFALMSRQLSMFIFPFILLMNPIRLMNYRKRFFWIFALTCIFTILYLYVDAIRVMLFYQLPVRSIVSASFINHNFSLPIGLHATYLSMYITLAMVFLVSIYYETVRSWKKALIIVCILIILAGLLQLGSRAVLIANLVIGLTIIPFILLNRQQRKGYLLVVAMAFGFIGASLFFSESLRNRYIYDLQTDLGKEVRENDNTTPRIERWKLGFELVKASLVIGHGSGDEADLLTEKYYQHKFYNAFLFRLNSHNQYLGFLIKSGILGLLVYLWVIFYCFRQALKRRDVLFLGFLVIIATVSFSENYLDVNKGIFFYAFFMSFFIIAEKKYRLAEEYKPAAGNLRQSYSVFTY